MIPAAVNQTAIKVETLCANRMVVDVFMMFKYFRISADFKI